MYQSVSPILLSLRFLHPAKKVVPALCPYLEECLTRSFGTMNDSHSIASITSRQRTVAYGDIVIVGNGIAGLTAALEARRLAPDASITIITEQSHPTINTPALKQFAAGKLMQEQLLAYPAGTERSQRISLVNAHVEGINAQSKYLHIRGGYDFSYGALLLATGSKPNVLPSNLPGRDFDGILSLHTLRDYLNLRRRLHEVRSAVVIGGGAHAIETVMSLLHVGIEVHWLIRGETFLSKMLDRPASEMVLEHTRRAGAKIHLLTEAIGVVGRVGSVIGVVTNQNQMIPCQLVLVCTGTSPVTTLAERCTIPMRQQQGILVDEQLRSSVRDIYAVGDVAAIKNPQTGMYETHAQWYAAVQQGRVVAAAITGHYHPVKHAIGVFWHATHLGELCMLTVGTPLTPLKDTVTLTNNGKKKYRRLSIRDDMLVGYLSLGTAQPDSLSIKRIIDEGLSVRSVKKKLLKGDFDARKYFSQSHSRAAREMVTSGKLPAISPTRTTQQLYPTWPVTTRPLPVPYSTEPLVTPQAVGAQFTAPLQHTYEPLRDSELFSPSIDSQLTIHEWHEEIRLNTDKLVTAQEKVVDTMLVPLPSRTTTRNFWSYSEKITAVPKQQVPVEKTPVVEQSENASRDKPTAKTNFLL
jgi:NADPH-dependent 2,4-dienoyl-CoA reductase/sulfur reductase-like enzyme